MAESLVFGWSNTDLAAVLSEVETALRSRMRLHHSVYRGGDYYRLDGEAGESLVLQANAELPAELAEPDAPQFVVLL